MSELLALKWRDVKFRAQEISVMRSIVFQVVGPCKTEASQTQFRLILTWQKFDNAFLEFVCNDER